LQIEITLVKAEAITWSSLLATSPASTSDPVAGPSTITAPALMTESAAKKSEKGGRKNWDRVVDDELSDGKGGEPKDPVSRSARHSFYDVAEPEMSQNAGGDAALQSLFSSIYSDADPDTRKAMIKSFTESGGTTLSTDWSSIGPGEN